MALPFPFDIVENFFRDFFNDIWDGILALPARIMNGLSSAFDSVRGFLSSGFNAVRDFITNSVNSAKNIIINALAGIPKAITDFIGSIDDVVRPFFTDISNRLFRGIADAGAFLNNAFHSGFRSIMSFIDNVGDSIRGGFNQLLSSFDHVNNAVTSAFSQFSRNVGEVINDRFGDLHGFIRIVNDNVNNAGKAVFDLTGGITGLGQSLLAGLSNIGIQILTPISNAATFVNDNMIKPIVNMFSDLIERARGAFFPTGSITPADARQQLNLYGGLAVAGHAGIVSIGALGEVFSFGQIDQIARGANDMMQYIGISTFARDLIVRDYEVGVRPALDREILARYEPLIPGAGDLVNMVVKEAFVPELVTPAPEIFARFMRENGFAREWSDRYWTAHWRPLAFDQALDLMNRGIIDRDEFLKRLIILDYRPDDAVKLEQLMRRLPNRIEMRLMARFGLVNDQQIEEVLNAEGIREDFREPLRVMMQEFNLTTVFSRYESTLLDAYDDGLLSDAEFENGLTEIKRPPGVIAMNLTLARFRRQLQYRKFQVTTIIDAASKGLMTKDEAFNELQKIGMDSERIGVLLARVQFRIDASVSGNTKAKVPELSLAKLQQALKGGVISLEEFIGALQAKNYSDQNIHILIELSGYAV